MLRVALTMRITKAEGYDESRDSISHDWIKRLGSWSILPLLISNQVDSPEDTLDILSPDLLILTGGDDLGATPVRDETENWLLSQAIETAVPVLGVCRGMQLINQYYGGRAVSVDGHVASIHTVRIAEPWQDCYGENPQVNSYHGQGIPKDSLGNGLKTAAIENNGMIEAFYHPERPVAAIMWHPERAGAPAGDFELINKMGNKDIFWI